MTNQTTMLREIIEEHSDRIKNMKKYYPYFRLAETSLAQYREGQFAEGLAEAVEAAGEKLKAFFPISSDDINEQPDEISFGK